MSIRPTLALVAFLTLAGAASAQDVPTGRELEVLRTFVTSLQEELADDVLPQFPLEAARVQAQFEGYTGETRTAGPLYRDGRGIKTAAWRLKDSVQDTLKRDIATLEPHAEATPELELLLERMQEIVDLRKGDAAYAELSHFRTAMGRFRVRFEQLQHLAALAARSLGLTPAASGTGSGRQGTPDFQGLDGAGGE
jgi:hypothetical protein